MQRSIRHFTFLEHSGSLCWLLVPDGHSEVEMALAGGTRPQNTRHQVRALTPEGHCRKAEFHHNLAEFSMRVTAYWSGIVGPDWVLLQSSARNGPPSTAIPLKFDPCNSPALCARAGCACVPPSLKTTAAVWPSPSFRKPAAQAKRSSPGPGSAFAAPRNPGPLQPRNSQRGWDTGRAKSQSP